jgi:2-phospho-L-lactate guanylyltransferase
LNDLVLWTAVIPLRSLSEGKTRLTAGLLSPESAQALIEAFATDLIQACQACPEIDQTLVVSPDDEAIALARTLGVDAIHETTESGINQAVQRGRAAARSAVVAILGDTPCITSQVLAEVLHEAGKHAVSFVPDTSGVGSTMWCAQLGSEQTSHFGHHSRAKHRAMGAVELGAGKATELWVRARRDVDTDVDLWDAQRLGVGAHTSRLLTTTPTKIPHSPHR